MEPLVITFKRKLSILFIEGKEKNGREKLSGEIGFGWESL